MPRASSMAVLAIVFGGPAMADALSGDRIRAEIGGRRVYLATPFGGEFPLNYHRNGVVDGDGEGSGLGRWMKPTDQGRWWVRGDMLCQQFQTWYNGAVKCFSLERAGPDRVRWLRDDGESGVARVGAPVEAASR